eukprot:5068025-Alexandrium_andersonii.AAC.1
MRLFECEHGVHKLSDLCPRCQGVVAIPILWRGRPATSAIDRVPAESKHLRVPSADSCRKQFPAVSCPGGPATRTPCG